MRGPILKESGTINGMKETAKNAAAKTKTHRYDVAKQLRTPEEIAAYLEAWLIEAPDDALGIARALTDIERAMKSGKR